MWAHMGEINVASLHAVFAGTYSMVHGIRCSLNPPLRTNSMLHWPLDSMLTKTPRFTPASSIRTGTHSATAIDDPVTEGAKLQTMTSPSSANPDHQCFHSEFEATLTRTGHNHIITQLETGYRTSVADECLLAVP